jgi:sugar O-acyltransferase (sialic acid O-acetyltransferase NeuD family)
MKEKRKIVEPVLIYGAGGHAKVVVDILERQKKYQIVGLLDDRPEKWDQLLASYRIIGGIDALQSAEWRSCKLILAVGDNKARMRLAHRLEGLTFQFATAIHPSAQIARDVTIHDGTVIMANAAVNSGTVLGSHVIVNTGSSVDHDCTIEDFAHIAPGAHVAGEVFVGSGTQVSIGASVIPSVHIGQWTIVGAGATVIGDLPDNVTAVGVPAAPIRIHSRVEVGL